MKNHLTSNPGIKTPYHEVLSHNRLVFNHLGLTRRNPTCVRLAHPGNHMQQYCGWTTSISHRRSETLEWSFPFNYQPIFASTMVSFVVPDADIATIYSSREPYDAFRWKGALCAWIHGCGGVKLRDPEMRGFVWVSLSTDLKTLIASQKHMRTHTQT